MRVFNKNFLLAKSFLHLPFILWKRVGRASVISGLVGHLVMLRSSLAVTRSHDHLALLVLTHVDLQHCRFLIFRGHKAVIKAEQTLESSKVRLCNGYVTDLPCRKPYFDGFSSAKNQFPNLNCKQRFLFLSPVRPLPLLLSRLLPPGHLAPQVTISPL